MAPPTPGSRSTTRRPVRLAEVARAAGVHPSTASRALSPDQRDRLNPDTVARVNEAAEQLGYERDVIATSLRSGTTMTVGVVVPDLDNPFQGPLLRGISSALEPREFVPMVTETIESHDRLARILSHMIRRRVSALIISAAHSTDRYLIEETVERGVPIVLAVRTLEAMLPGTTSITADDFEGARLAGRHLVDLGHRRMAQLRGPLDISSFAQRAEGFRGEIARGGAVDISLERPVTEVTAESGYALMSEILARPEPPPTAVFAHADVMAIGAIKAIRANGLRCPTDISVLGYNNAPLTDAIDPPLSTIDVPAHNLGAGAARLALSLVEDREREVAPVVLPTHLLVRESTAAPTPTP